MRKKLLTIAVITFVLAGAGMPSAKRGGGHNISLAAPSATTAGIYVNASVDQDPYRSVLTKSFSAAKVKTMAVRVVSADVEVKGDAGPQATVEALARGANGARLSAAEIQQRLDKYYRITTEVEGGQLAIRVEFKQKNISDKQRLQLKFLVHVPKSTTADIHTVSGDVRLAETAGLRIATTSGDIELQNVLGDVESRSVSGDFRAEGISGKLTVRTTSGDIQARRVTSLVSATSVSGDLDIETMKLLSDVWLKTTSGDIKLKTGEKSGLNLKIGTVSGDLNIQGLGTVDYHTKTRKHIEAQVGGGGKLLEAKTVSGDITIGKI